MNRDFLILVKVCYWQIDFGIDSKEHNVAVFYYCALIVSWFRRQWHKIHSGNEFDDQCSFDDVR